MGKGLATTCVCQCKIDKGFLIPNGILKIIETVINIICLALAVQYFWCGFSWWGQNTNVAACWSSSRFAVATAAIFFVFTLLLFLLFLFTVPDMAGGKKVWGIIDIVHDIIAVIFYLVTFILACVYAYDRGPMIALAIFALLNLIAYIISLAFAVMGIMGKTVIKVSAT